MANLARTKPGVDEDARFRCLDIGAISGRSAAENRKMNSHGLTLVSQVKHINDFSWLLQVARLRGARVYDPQACEKCWNGWNFKVMRLTEPRSDRNNLIRVGRYLSTALG